MCPAPKGFANPSMALVDSLSPDMNSLPIDMELTNGIKSNFAPRFTTERKASTCPTAILPDCNAASASNVRKRNDVYIREPYVIR